jgi:transposase
MSLISTQAAAYSAQVVTRYAWSVEPEMLWGRRRADGTIVALDKRRSCPMPKPADLNRCLAALDQDRTIIAVIEMSQSSWLVAGIVPGIERHPLKKLAPDQDALLKLLHRWREEAGQAGREITRIAVAFEAGRDGFWLARWLRAHGVEAHVIHPTSVAVSREHRRAKTDRLDTALLKRVFLGWLRGEPDHCHMAAIPTLAEEDARRPTRERECLVGERTRIVNRIKAALARLGVRGFKPTLRNALQRLDALRTPEGTALPPNTRAELHRDMARLHVVTEQIQQIEAARGQRLEQAGAGPNAMVRLLAQVVGVGLATADMLVHEVLSRNLRDRRAVARYAGLTGSPDESGRRRREKGLAKAGNARVRRGMIQLAWRFLLHQKESALAQWYRARTADARGSTRKTLIVALARKLLIALWRMVTTGEAPHGVVLRPAA